MFWEQLGSSIAESAFWVIIIFCLSFAGCGIFKFVMDYLSEEIGTKKEDEEEEE